MTTKIRWECDGAVDCIRSTEGVGGYRVDTDEGRRAAERAGWRRFYLPGDRQIDLCPECAGRFIVERGVPA